MASSTTNYNLIKPDYEDDADIKDLNDNFDTIDTAMNNLEEGKQAALTTAQMAAVNSGIDSTKVAQIETNKNNISKQQDTTASGGNGYAIINGRRLYMGAAQTPERIGDIWLDGATVRESEYLLSANPLCGIGDYKETLNLATGACERIVKKFVLTGEESIGTTTVGSVDIFKLAATYTSDKVQERANLSMMSNVYDVVSTRAECSETNYSLCTFNITTDLSIVINDSRFQTTTEFKTWLQQQYAADNPVVIWYVLAAPTTETITVPSGNTGTVEGYLTQSGTPTPTAPIYPTANEVLVWG